MTATRWEEVLVIILAATLALFLVLAIIATIKIIQILNHVKHISEKAEQFADKAEATAEAFRKTAHAAPFFTMLNNVVSSYRERKGHKK